MKQYNLTDRQLLVYNYIKDYYGKNNMSPYIREIQEACGITSYKVVVDRLFALEKKGYIRRKLNKHRSIVLNPPKVCRRSTATIRGAADQKADFSDEKFGSNHTEKC